MTTFIREGHGAPFVPNNEFNPGDPIRFHHPGYPSSFSVFLCLERVDTLRAEVDKLGVHHGTALLACQLISNNNFDGRLYLDRHGQYAVAVSVDGILTQGDYYFHVGRDCT